MTTFYDEMPPLTQAEREHWGVKAREQGLPHSGNPYFSKGDNLAKFCIASFHRASDGALSKLIDLIEPVPPEEAHYIIVPGDRKETFEFALDWYSKKPLIHLWAGEISQGTHDEIYRWAITNMSMMQLCTTDDAADRVKMFCKAIGKDHDVRVVGNVMRDNLPVFGYDLVLYNPPTTLPREMVEQEVKYILDILEHSPYKTYFWHPPNGDMHTDLVEPYVNAKGLSREHFLNHLKHCTRFISNSSCIDYEARGIIPDDRIIRIGERNSRRSSQNENMEIPNATENIMNVLKELSDRYGE